MARTKSFQQDRFRLIWALLIWEGSVGNSRLRELLPLETVMVSRLLTAFTEAFPTSVIWERHARRYRPTGATPEGYDLPSLEEYLSLIGKAPNSLPWLERSQGFTPHLQPKVFAAVQMACAHRCGLRLTYASMTTPAGEDRIVHPHSMIQIGERWIVRAWCPKREGFIDLMLDRMIKAQAELTLELETPTDERWDKILEVRLKAHDDLPEAYAKLVRRYRFNGAAAAKRNLRAAIIPYVLQHVRAAIDPESERPPAYELQVTNPAVVMPYRFPKFVESTEAIEEMCHSP